MKKLKKFLSFALLTVTCCFSAHAKIDGRPATREQHQQFIQEMKKFAVEYAKKNNTLEIVQQAEKNTVELDEKQNIYTRTAQHAHVLYTIAIERDHQMLNCRACASFALLKMEKLGIQCGYVQGYFDHVAPARNRIKGQILPKPSLDDAWHDTVVYSVENGEKPRQWYVCDMQLALHCACLEQNRQTSWSYRAMRPKNKDFTYFLAIPLDEYINKFAMPEFKNVITVRKDDCRDKVLTGGAISMSMSLYSLLTGQITCQVVPTFHLSLNEWLIQANSVSM